MIVQTSKIHCKDVTDMRDFETFFRKNYVNYVFKWAPLLTFMNLAETLYTHLLYIFGLNKKIEGTYVYYHI